jgi:hypothetical protein
MTVLSYVLRIHCESGESDHLPPLIGLVEDAAGEERSFRSLEELGLILRKDLKKCRPNTRQESQ